IVAREMKMLGSKADSERTSGASAAASGSYDRSGSADEHAASGSSGYDRAMPPDDHVTAPDASTPPEITDDDLPF
ncbi:MAG: hypothetical protein ACRD2O_18490, partial [Terriglobia bacterium]